MSRDTEFDEALEAFDFDRASKLFERLNRGGRAKWDANRLIATLYMWKERPSNMHDYSDKVNKYGALVYLQCSLEKHIVRIRKTQVPEEDFTVGDHYVAPPSVIDQFQELHILGDEVYDFPLWLDKGDRCWLPDYGMSWAQVHWTQSMEDGSRPSGGIIWRNPPVGIIWLQQRMIGWNNLYISSLQFDWCPKELWRIIYHYAAYVNVIVNVEFLEKQNSNTDHVLIVLKRLEIKHVYSHFL